MRFSGFKVISEALRGHKGWEATWRDATPKSHYDYIIIGGGGHGLAGRGALEPREADPSLGPREAPRCPGEQPLRSPVGRPGQQGEQQRSRSSPQTSRRRRGGRGRSQAEAAPELDSEELSSPLCRPKQP